MDQGEQPQAVSLQGAGVPADHGLSALGLLMQLGGTLFAAAMCLAIFTSILDFRGHLNGELLWLMLVLGSCAVRSLFHRQAGIELLYGNRSEQGGSSLAALRRYIQIGIVHSVLVAGYLVWKTDAAAKYAVVIAIAFALWPMLLALLLATSRFKDLKELPIAEDKGFESASILMTIMGVLGTMVMGCVFFVLLKDSDKLMSSGYGILVIGAVGTLFVRSVLHVQAGYSGLRETSLDRSVERANRYGSFGIIASFAASGALLLVAMQGAVHLMVFVLIAIVCWMLLAWPLVVRRFFSDRQFADLVAGDAANLHRRAPDAGLTGLGWFLIATATMSAAFVLPQVILPEARMGSDAFNEITSLLGGHAIAGRSIWWNVGLVMLQGWAGFELLRMTPAHKIVATVFGVVTAGVVVYQYLPIIKLVGDLDKLGGITDIARLYLPLALALMVPVTTILLVNRRITPMARARFRAAPTRQTSS